MRPQPVTTVVLRARSRRTRYLTCLLTSCLWRPRHFTRLSLPVPRSLTLRMRLGLRRRMRNLSPLLLREPRTLRTRLSPCRWPRYWAPLCLRVSRSRTEGARLNPRRHRAANWFAHVPRRPFLHSRLRIRARRALRTLLPELLRRTSALSRWTFLPLYLRRLPTRRRRGRVVALSPTRQRQSDRQHQAGRCHPPRFGFPRHNRSPRFQFSNFLLAAKASRSGPHRRPVAPADRPADRNSRTDQHSCREPAGRLPQFPAQADQEEATDRRR